MKTIIKILCLSVLWFSCEVDYDDSETYFDVDIYHSYTDIMMQFSDNLDLSQFDFQYFIDILHSHSEGSEFMSDTLGVYFISNPDIFGTDCYLFYDDNKKTLTGHIEANSTGGLTGHICKPEYLNNLKSQNGIIVDTVFDNLISPQNMYVSPNPYLVSSPYELDDVSVILTFNGLPDACRIHIYDGNKELVNELDHYGDGPEFWNLRDSNNQDVQSGAYYYEIFDLQEQVISRQGSIIIIQKEANEDFN